MKNGWVKIFQGYYLTGADEDNVSWSQTQLDNLRGVQVFHNGLCLELIRGPGEYHYSEDYEVAIGSNEHVLMTRRVQFLTDTGWETIEVDVGKDEVHKYMSDTKI